MRTLLNYLTWFICQWIRFAPLYIISTDDYLQHCFANKYDPIVFNIIINIRGIFVILSFMVG